MRKHYDLLRQIFKDIAILDHKQPYVLFGADIKGIMLYQWLSDNGFDIQYFVDNDIGKQDGDIHGKPVYAVEKLRGDKASKVIFTLSPHFIDTVSKQLTDIGIDNNRIIIPQNLDFAPFGSRNEILSRLRANEAGISLVTSLLEDDRSKNTLKGIVKYCETLDMSEIGKIYDDRYPQYFDEELIVFGNDEVFVDGGCLDFNTSFHFMDKAPLFKKIYAFEPDCHNFLRIKDLSKHVRPNKIELFNKAIYSGKKSLSFHNRGSFWSQVSDSGSNRIEADCLDNLIDGATFIKFDIEGCEYEGLLGSRRIITNYKSKLAISVYHKLSDLWEIPLLIKEFYEGYRLYFRHYHKTMHTETICYAIP